MLRHAAQPEVGFAIAAELDQRYSQRYREKENPSPWAGYDLSPDPPEPQRPFDSRYAGNSARTQQDAASLDARKNRYGATPHIPSSQSAYTKRPRASTNWLAVTSLVLAILWIFWLGSIAGIIVGWIALNQIRARNQSGKGLAVAGILIGAAALLLAVVYSSG
jgi:Domain of unknown function (DUF4190)